MLQCWVVYAENMWYFMQAEQEKNSEHGSWNARGDADQIYRNSNITGWRTTLEYYEGHFPYGQRTSWVMQEYRINHKLHNGNSKVNHTTYYHFMVFSWHFSFIFVINPTCQSIAGLVGKHAGVRFIMQSLPYWSKPRSSTQIGKLGKFWGKPLSSKVISSSYSRAWQYHWTGFHEWVPGISSLDHLFCFNFCGECVYA